MSTTPAVKRPSNIWIVSPSVDLLFFIAAPLLLVPLFLLLLNHMSLERISVLVISFGAVGHHLPGMLRAYGDADLFRRYRVRFVVSPVLIVAVSLLFSFYRPDALRVLVIAWGFWHSQAQIYGFLRIYDSKCGFTDRASAMIDRALCISWFLGGIVFSSGRMSDFLNVYYRTGGPFLKPEWLQIFRWVMLGAMALSTLLYCVHLAKAAVQGRRPGVSRILTLVISIGFWWYCMVFVSNAVLGVALYEVFHDVQYLAIVWYFNQRRAATTGSAAGWLTAALFRPQYRYVVLYVGLVLLYGAGSLITQSLDRSLVQTVLTGLFVASGLLHFYYDGFIWRIRETTTGAALGVTGESRSGSMVLQSAAAWLPHCLMWLAFALPLLWFGLAPTIAREHASRLVVSSMPQSGIAEYNLAAELYRNAELSEAHAHARKAVALIPEFSKACALLGEIELAGGTLQQATQHLGKAVDLDPRNAVAWFNLGNAYLKLQSVDAATDAYHSAMTLDQNLETSCYNNLGSAFMELGATRDAEGIFEQALQADPQNASALNNLAGLHSQKGDFASSEQLYRRALKVEPENAPTHADLIRTLLSAGKAEQAQICINTFQQACPQHPDPPTFQGMLLLQQQRFDAAEAAFQQALQRSPDHIPALYGLASLALRLGQLQKCNEIVDRIQEVAETSAHRILITELRSQLKAKAPPH